jgi:hypothetical protein
MFSPASNHYSNIFARAIDRLAGFLGPIIEGIGNTLGMHVSVLVGGPEPRKNGQINVIRYVALMPHSDTDLTVGYSMHHGVNKAAVPKNWGMVDKAKYKAVTQSFVQYLETCYSASRLFLPSSLIANSVAYS